MLSFTYVIPHMQADGLLRPQSVVLAHLVPAVRIQQIQYSVRSAANVHLNWHPVLLSFRLSQISGVLAHLMPEARIQQMQYSMLSAADIQVDRHPVLLGFRIHERLRVGGVDEAQEVPTASRPLQSHTVQSG